MAEFKEVMRAYHRMCDSYHHCEGCPFREELLENCEPTGLNDEEDLDIWETTVMEWARTHPEPVYPSIHDILDYMYDKMNGRLDVPITEELAKEFNIMPINECGLTKYEKGEWAP